MTRSRLTLCALMILSVSGAACDDSSPAAPTTNEPFVFTAVLSPSNEVPPVGNAESTGRGAVQVTINAARDSSGNLTGGTAAFHFQVSGFPEGTRIQGAHIHSAAAGVNGPIVVDTGVTATSPVATSGGMLAFDASGIPVSAATLDAIIRGPSLFYFNVHSPLNPGGFARGQLVRTNTF